MKTLYLRNLICALLFLSGMVSTQAQNISNYNFTASSGTFTALSGSTAPTFSGGSTNDGWYNSIPIGFEFWFMGTRYDNIGASTNGWLTFGLGSTSITNANAANSFSSNSVPRPFVAPLWDDLDFTQSLGVFSYKTTGTAPNRIFTAEWLNAEWGWSANDSVISFQVKLYETSGKIDFIYRQENSAVTSGSASIGIEGASTFQSLNGTGTAPSSSTTTNTINLSTKPATGQIYSFTPPTPAAPTGISFSSVTQNSMTVNWTDNATNEFGYVIYISTDSINYTFQTQYAANTTTGSMICLAPTTKYFYKIYAVTEGGFSNVLMGSQTTLTGTLSGVIAIPGTYSTITAAIAALATSGFSNSVVLELQSSYSSSGETFPINIPNNLGTSPTKTITLRPASGVSSLTITANSSTSILNFNGCKYFTIDGRSGGVGTTIALTINNDNTNYSQANTINFVNDASRDTIRYCNIMGNNLVGSGSLCGTITFSSTSGTTGNDSNDIEYCTIHAGTYYNPTVLIFSYGTSGKENNSNTIANNNLYDFLPNSSYQSAIGIYIYNNSTDFRITGNHIYQTQSLTATNAWGMYGIYFNNTTGNITISNNYIGGSAPYCGSSAWQLGSVSTANVIYPIYVISSTTLPSTISGNTLSNYLLATNSSAPFYGIYISGGLCNITGNTIGSSTGTGNIMVVSEYVGTAYVYGINSQSINNTISNNFIGSYDVSGTLSTHNISLYGIRSYSNNQVTGNTITNLTNETPAATIYGIFSAYGTNNISQNIITNLYSTNTTTAVNIYGINSFSNDTINRNFIHSFSILSNSTTSKLSGIYCSYSASVRNNMIQLGIKPDGNSLTAPCSIYGIYNNGASIRLLHNSIHIGGTGVASGSVNTACYYNNSGSDYVYNNIFYNCRINGSTGGNHYTIYISNNYYINVCNYNLFYTGVPLACMIYSGGITYTNFATYKSATGFDANSAIADPRFVNITGNSAAVNLHINSAYATPIESLGSSTYTTTDDYDGQIRASYSPVDIGADAGNFTALTLPVKWLSFEGKLLGNKNVLCTWQTASEINNDYFEVQRSYEPAANSQWLKAGIVKGNGTINSVSSYQFIDNISDLQLPTSIIYYRLKQTDIDGNFDYSNTIPIVLNKTNDAILISPNPFTNNFELQLPSNFNNDAVTIDIKDLQGRSVFTQTYSLQKDQSKVLVETNTLNSGIYFVNFTTKEGVSKYQKLVKQ